MGTRESLNGHKTIYGTKKNKERREEPLGTMSYQTSSKRSPPVWLLVFWHQSEARPEATVWNWSGKTLGAFHLVKISGISGSAVNGTRFVGSSHWKIPRKSGKSKKVVPFSRLEFPNGMSCSIYVSRSLYQFQVHGRAPRHVPGFTTKWNNFLPIGNSTFATTEISGFFS